jgi:hypothetical protein
MRNRMLIKSDIDAVEAITVEEVAEMHTDASWDIQEYIDELKEELRASFWDGITPPANFVDTALVEETVAILRKDGYLKLDYLTSQELVEVEALFRREHPDCQYTFDRTAKPPDALKVMLLFKSMGTQYLMLAPSSEALRAAGKEWAGSHPADRINEEFKTVSEENEAFQGWLVAEKGFVSVPFKEVSHPLDG